MRSAVYRIFRVFVIFSPDLYIYGYLVDCCSVVAARTLFIDIIVINTTFGDCLHIACAARRGPFHLPQVLVCIPFVIFK